MMPADPTFSPLLWRPFPCAIGRRRWLARHQERSVIMINRKRSIVPVQPSPVNALIELDRGVASLLGDRRGRTVSRVIGHGLSDATGLGRNTATDLGHIAMVAAVAIPKARPWVAAGLALAFVAGLSSRR